MNREKKQTLEKDKKDKKEKKNTIKNDEVKKDAKQKKNILSIIMGYFKGVKKEISRIRWTKGKELGKYSVAAVSIIFFFCVYFYIIDVLVALLRSNL